MRMYASGTERVLQESLEDAAANVNLVMIEWCSPGYSFNHGLAISLALAKTGRDVLMLGWQRIADFASDPRWHACMAYRNIDFARLPLDIDTIRALLETTPCNQRPADPLALRLLEASREVDLIKTLKHDLPGLEDRPLEAQENFELDAGKLFGHLSVEELKAKVLEAPNDSPLSAFSGEVFPDVFVDIEDTLLEGGALNYDLLNRLSDISKCRPITIWTGGDITQLEPQLRHFGIPYKVASKHLFKGCKVATAYDNLPQSEFYKLYGIEVEEYIQV